MINGEKRRSNGSMTCQYWNDIGIESRPINVIDVTGNQTVMILIVNNIDINDNEKLMAY